MNTPHLLLEMTEEPDCRFLAAWLFRAAQAQRLWSRALEERDFADHVALLHADGIPDLAARAMEIFGELEHQHHVATVELNPDTDILFDREFGLLERLGFFTYSGDSYWMALPKVLTSAAVKRAALEVATTVEMDGLELICPERLLHTLSKKEAEGLRAGLMARRRFSATHDQASHPAETKH
ncbi:hypothetical protein [Bradyrhizobium sp. USDA 3650]